MTKIEFTVPGNPQALKRHRSVRCGKFIRQYAPSAGDKQDFLAKAMENRPEKPLSVPLSVSLIFTFTRPKSHFGTGKNAGILRNGVPALHISKPDCDNLAKFVLDALNGVYWRDDCVIVMLSIKKVYGDNPSVRVLIGGLSND